MAEIDQEHRAQMAQDLLDNEVLAEAFTAVRLNALTELAVTDPSDLVTITRLQAIAGCLQEVRDLLIADVVRAGKHDGGYSASPELN